MSLDLDKTGWKRVAFGDVVRNVNRTVKDPAAVGLDRVIAMEHLDPGELKIARWGDLADGTTFTRRVEPGQTLFGKRRAYQRKAAYSEFAAVCSGDLLTFEADEDHLLSEFLPFIVQSDGFYDHALGTSAGSLSPRTNWRDLANYEFDLPPRDEQQRIADLMWALERHRRALADAGLRAVGARDGWLDNLLSVNEWPSMTVSQLVTSGPTNGKSAKTNDEGRGVPTLSISAIRDGYVRGGPSVKYMDVASEAVKKFVIEDGDFFVVRGNGNKQLTARGGLAVGGLPEGCVYPDLLIRLRFDRDLLLPSFAAAQWNSSAAHAALLQHAKSTNGIWKINGKDVKSHHLVVPPLAAQRGIVHHLKTLDGASEAIARELSALDSLRSSLLADIFGGAG